MSHPGDATLGQKEFEVAFSVRDYECDLQGVVNNATYLHYLEHTRHEFLRSIGVDFAALHREGRDLMVSRMELDYLAPLASGDRFVVVLTLEQKGRLRVLFHQQILRLPQRQPVLRGLIVGVCVQAGHPVVPQELIVALERWGQLT